MEISTTIIADDNQGHASAQSQLVNALSQHAKTMIPMYEIMQTPLS
jgi:hypothetical protein